MRKACRSKTGVIFNIQKFSVNDGPGIRTTVFFKGCPLHCRWCSNPESQLPMPQLFWDRKKCLNCHRCLKECPQRAISLFQEHIHIHPAKCNGCGLCIPACPAKALEMQGETKSVQEVIDVVMQDAVFYEEGGGITLSGGEFLTQPSFAFELLLAAKEEGLRTCCETTGYAETEVFGRMLPYLDYILFDMKHWDEHKHIEGTGISNALPRANLMAALALGKEVLIRIPVIPGFNNALSDASGFAGTLSGLGIKRCQLLPFHQFGENKYGLLDRPYAYAQTPSLHPEELEDFRQAFSDYGVKAFF